MKRRTIALLLALSLLLSGLMLPLGENVYAKESSGLPEKYDLRDYGLVTPLRFVSAGDNSRASRAITIAQSLESNALKAGWGKFELENNNNADRQWTQFPYSDYTTKFLIKGTSDKYIRIKEAFGSSIASRDSLKNQIMTYGSACVDFWIYKDGKDYYNEETKALYQSKENSHLAKIGFEIIGWDDNFSKDNFATTPSGDGAWIVRTPGEVNTYCPIPEDLMNGGYFYLSFYDCNILKQNRFAYSYIAAPGEYQDFNYQYGSNDAEKCNATSAAIYFKAIADQTLTSILVGTYDVNDTIYATIRVYKCRNEYDTNSESNTDFVNDLNSRNMDLIYEESGVKMRPGEEKQFNALELRNIVNINKGDNIAVIIDFNRRADVVTAVTTQKGHNRTCICNDGKWKDCGDKPLFISVRVRNGHNKKIIDGCWTLDSLSIKNNEESKLTLTWNRDENAEGYDIYRKEIKDTKTVYTLVATVDNSVTKYTDTNVKLGLKYSYKVVPFAGNREGTSIEKTAEVKIAAPYIKKLENTTAGQVKITCSVVKRDSYSIYRADPGKAYKWIGNTKTTVFIDKNAKKGASYYYKVRANRDGKQSNLSAGKKITVTK